MQKILVAFIVFLLAISTDSFASSPQVLKAGFVVQNISDLSSPVAIELYNPDGSKEYQVTLTIDPHSSWLVDPDDLVELAPGWSGSAIITSSSFMVGAGWAETFSKYGKPEGVGWYNLHGANAASFTAYVPLVRMDPAAGFGFNLWLQNTGNLTATVTVTYYAHGEVSTYNSTCPDLVPGASMELIASCTPILPDLFTGSAVISSDRPVVAVANQSNPAKMTQCLYNGVSGSDGDMELFFPIVQNNYQGWYSSFTVQNTGASAAQGNFEYYADCGNATCEMEGSLSSASIIPGNGYVFTPVVDSFSGYGKFTSDGLFAGVAQVWNDPVGTGYCYNGFMGGAVESSWFLPSVNGYSKIVVKNTSDIIDASITVSWSGLPDQQIVNLLPNDKQEITPAVPAGWSGSGVVQSTGGLPLAIVVKNMQSGGNDRGAYTAYGNSKGAASLYVPLVRKAEQFQSTIWKIYTPAILKGTKVEE